MDATDNQTAFVPQWEPAATHPWLAVGDVHLWRARLDEPLAMPLLRETLNVFEALQAERMPDAGDRREFIAARGLLRFVLGGYLQMAPLDVPLVENGEGQPFLLPPFDDVFFDISCTDGLALVAVSRTHGLGLDLERIRENVPFAEIAGHYFEPEETWDVVTLRGPERAWKFFDFWTSQEATRRLSNHGPRARAGLAVNQLSPADGFTAAIAIRGGDYRLACWDWQTAA